MNVFETYIMPNAPEDSRVHKFLDNVVKACISEDSTYPPSVWTSCGADEKRTTNCSESFHSHFGAQFCSSHPDIFDFLEQLKNEQSKVVLKIKASSKEAPLRK